MLTILHNQAEGYKRKLDASEKAQKTQWEDKVAPVLEANATEISELRRELALVRKSKDQACQRAASKGQAEAKAAKKKLEEMCEVSMKQRYRISELEGELSVQKIQMRRMQETTAAAEQRAVGTERLLKTRGKRCEELHQAHSDMKDQMTKIEELRSPSPVSRRRSIPPPPSPVGLSTPTSEGADGSTLDAPKKPPASAAKLRQLAREDSPDVLRKMIVSQMLVERFRLHKAAQVAERVAKNERTTLSLQVELGQLRGVLKQSQAEIKGLEDNLQSHKWMHQDLKETSASEISTLRRLVETYRGEHVRSPCQTKYQPPPSPVPPKPHRPHSAMSSVTSSGSGSRKKASSRQGKSETSEDWTAALDELGGAFQFA